MMIQVTETSRQNALGNEYLFVSMQCGKHAATVMICRGASNYVQVIVENAVNRAWRGMGKRFANADVAMKSYKTAAIREMIATACEMK